MNTRNVHDRLNGIEAFVQAAEAGSFALAAERLLTRSAVGKSIARLEARLGVRLFHRTTRQQSLTDDGQAYYDRCVRALAELQAAEAELDSGRREPQGRLRVTAPRCSAGIASRRCCASWRAAIQLEVDISFSDRVVDLIDEGYDLGIRVGDLPDSSSLAARRLGLQTMGIGASPAAARPSRHGAGDAARTPASSMRGGRTWTMQDEDGRAHSAPAASLRLDDLQAIADAAIAGAGLALPCWMLARYVGTGELEVLMHGDQLAAHEVHAVWPQARHLPSKTRAAIDALAARVPAMLAP